MCAWPSRHVPLLFRIRNTSWQCWYQVPTKLWFITVHILSSISTVYEAPMHALLINNEAKSFFKNFKSHAAKKLPTFCGTRMLNTVLADSSYVSFQMYTSCFFNIRFNIILLFTRILSGHFPSGVLIFWLIINKSGAISSDCRTSCSVLQIRMRYRNSMTVERAGMLAETFVVCLKEVSAWLAAVWHSKLLNLPFGSFTVEPVLKACRRNTLPCTMLLWNKKLDLTYRVLSWHPGQLLCLSNSFPYSFVCTSQNWMANSWGKHLKNARPSVWFGFTLCILCEAREQTNVIAPCYWKK
jgi:hypothetical protein